MNNGKLDWDLFEAIAWVINENSAMVDYIDDFSPYEYIIADDYYLYLSTTDEFKKNHTALSRWYKDYANKDDMNEVYDFFKVAFDKDKLNHALEVGSDEAIMDFLRHAYASADISTTDHNLNMVLEVIHDILNDQKEQQQERNITCK